jgi:hypothetical protein
MFSVWSIPRVYNKGKLPLEESLETAVRRVGGWCEMAASLGVSEVKWNELADECGRGLLRFRRCEKPVAEAGDSSRTQRMGKVHCTEPLPDNDWWEDTANWEDFVHAVVKCRVCELAITLWLLVVMFCKCSINPITNPNPVYSQSRHSVVWQVE